MMRGTDQQITSNGLDADMHRDIACTEKLLKIGERFYHATESDARRCLLPQILDTIYELVDLKYDKMIRADALLTSSTFDDHRQQLMFVFTCLDHCHQFEELSDDFLKWIMSRFIRSRISIVVNAKFGGFLQEKILHLAGLINDKQSFLTHVVMQLARLVNGGNDFSLSTATGKYDTHTDLVNVLDCRSTVYSSLLDVIRHVNFKYESLSCRTLQILWLSLVKICSEGHPRLKTTCVLLFQRLLSLDLGNEIACRLVFDVIMATEEFIVREINSADGLETLIQAHESCLKVLMELLRDMEHKKSFNNIAVSVILSWGIRAAELASQFTVIPFRFELITTSVSRLLSRLQGDLPKEHLDLMNRLADLIQVVVEHLLTVDVTHNGSLVDHLQSYFSFLLNTDCLSSQNERSQWIITYCESQWQRLMSNGKHGDAMKIRRIATASLALCKGEKASSVFRSILPSEQQLIQVIEATSTLGSAAASVLLNVFELVGDLVSHQTTFPTSSLVAFLSLPWLMDPELQLQSKRHMTSIPLLKEMNRLARLNLPIADEKILEYTLSAMSMMQGFCDWRRTILLSAMSSPRPVLVQAALSHLAMFVSSLDTPSLHRLLTPAVQLASNPSFRHLDIDMACVLSALSHSLCASHSESRVHKNAVECPACERLLAGMEVPEQDKVQQLAGLPELLLKVLTDGKYNIEKHIRLDAAALLLTTFCHVLYSPNVYLKLAKASLYLINDEDEDVRAVYKSAFKVIVSSALSSELVDDIFVEQFCKSYPLDCDQTMAEASNIFVVLAAKHSRCPRLADKSLHQLFVRALRYPGSISIFDDCKLTIQQLAAQEFKEGRDVLRRFFARRKRAFCENIVDEVFVAVSRADHTEEVLDEELDDFLGCAHEVFGYDNLCSFVRSAVYIVPFVLLSDVKYRRVSVQFLDRIRAHLAKHRQDLVSEYFPSVLEKPLNSAQKKSLKSFIKEYCDLDLRYLFYTKRFLCTVYALRSISLDTPGYLEILQTIRGTQREIKEPFSLTSVMKFNCEYLGFLLSFRRSLLDDDHYEQRDVLLSSLATIIRLVDQKFLEETSHKIMVVLRAATFVGEGSVAVWSEFVQRLSDGMLANLLPKILIAIQPLLRFPATNSLLDSIFDKRKPLEIEQSEAFERTALVLLNSEAGDSSRINFHLKRTCSNDTTEHIISSCVRMLLEECDTVGRVVLHKLLTVLDGNPLPDSLSAELIPALLHTMRSCSDKSLRVLSAQCLGKIGAVDPGRIGSSALGLTNNQKKIAFVDDAKEFYIDILERAWRVYSNILDADVLDQVEYALQSLLSELVGKTDEFGIMERLSEECRRDIEPFRSSSLVQTHDRKGPIKERPIVDHTSGYEEWLLQCFIIGVPKVRQHPEKELFKALKWIVFAKDAVFTRHVLPQLIVRLILENNELMIKEYRNEMTSVLERVVTNAAGWMRLAAHVVFSVLDTLEQYAIRRMGKKRPNDKELERTQAFLSHVFSQKTSSGSLLVVEAAERCQCLHRALRWCEQHEIKQDELGGNIFDRNHFYTLQRIYTQLQNVDAVAGAFECISACTSPTADERILALEANGDYNEALPLYSQSSNNKELQLIKCLLRLNQPQLALNTAISLYESEEEKSPQIVGALASSQLEATWHLRDWGKLEKMIQKCDPLLDRNDCSWGASCASILCAVKRRESAKLTERILAARERLVERITAKTIEDSNTYAQAYKCIASLHILEEIEESTSTLSLLSSSRSVDLDALLAKWQNRSECVTQCCNILEPILLVRRELLRASADAGAVERRDVDNALTQLLVQSCRLARQSGHVQIAWTFLVEAKALGVNLKDVGMEEARFEFQKGNQSQAIGLLSKLLTTKFADMNKLFNSFVQWHETGAKSSAGSPDVLVKRTSRESRAAFAEVQLLRAEYMLKSGAVAANDLYQIYLSLQKFDVPSEDLHYRVAVFCDGMYSIDTEKVRSDLVANILKSYANALRFGRNHLFHAMPRMLTIWLDVSQKKTETMQTRGSDARSIEMNHRDNNDIAQMNTEISRAFRQLDSYTFYTAFPQLISRIVHPNSSVFTTLKAILADLICKYPHQCLWQSIAVYRTVPWQKNIRQERCAQVFAVVKNKRHNMDVLIDQYDYVASILIELAEKKIKACGSFSDLPKVAPRLHNFFERGELCNDLLMGAKERGLSGMRTVTPTVMIPLTEMLEHALPKDYSDKVCQFSQFVMDASTPAESPTELPEVFICNVDPEYLVLKSMLRPKRIALRGGDGRRYLIMCKPNDELRKDARFMDVNRMMNSLMRQNADARRRQLFVRTFSVIPLQEAGGIVEWVPNLTPYRGVLQPLFEEKGDPLPDAQWFANWNASGSLEDRLEKMRTFFYRRYPLVMAEWFRRQFLDPSVWYAARLAYSRSCAVMSMIGFVLGLGDRHGENILIDVTEGCVVHVDFNLIFHKGEYLPVREVVPFRLTRNMVNGFGPTGVEGSFRRSCESTLRVMRENKDTLLTVIQTFVHDPLLEWINTEARAQQNRGRGQQKVNAPSTESVQLILKRLEGHIVSPEVYKHKFSCAPMSLEGQVAKLIDIASDEKNLAQMYIGWGPFI